MRLVNCKIKNYKRLKDVVINLDRDIIAIVGPNEAGKSSLFEVLQFIENSDPLMKHDSTRGLNSDSKQPIIRVEYALDEIDHNAISGFFGVGTPRFYFLEKYATGNKIHGVTERVKRNKTPRKQVYELILKTLSSNKVKNVLDTYPSYQTENDLDDASGPELREIFQELANEINTDDENLNNETTSKIERVNTTLKVINKNIEGQKREILFKLQDQLGALMRLETMKHPNDLFLEYLNSNRPKFLFFGQEERMLKDSYLVDDLLDPPPSLGNLLKIARIDINGLHESISDKNYGTQEFYIENGNIELMSRFSESWNQSNVYPKFQFGDNELRILVKYTNSYTKLTERSDGLRQFIALYSFVSGANETAKPILLIDEAEIHLHYAAQADLVGIFETQNLASGIIYSTHSAGCLPSDLGTGIRVVQPMIDTETKLDLGYSIINNSVWQVQGGFSPLLLAMGANIIAFTLARKAVIAEGLCETAILPRLLKESNELRNLDFQVAPGIANVSQEDAYNLEFEASRVVYLVDGDKSGNFIRKKLTSAGISPTKIISLNESLTIEDYISSEYLLLSINEELRMSGHVQIDINEKSIPFKGKLEYFKTVCKKKGIPFPNKVRIVDRIALYPKDIKVYDERRKHDLIALLEILNKSLV